MPLTPFEIMMAKNMGQQFSRALGTIVALTLVIQGVLEVPIAGSLPLFLFSSVLYLFSAASIGIFSAHWPLDATARFADHFNYRTARNALRWDHAT